MAYLAAQFKWAEELHFEEQAPTTFRGNRSLYSLIIFKKCTIDCAVFRLLHNLKCSQGGEKVAQCAIIRLFLKREIPLIPLEFEWRIAKKKEKWRDLFTFLPNCENTVIDESHEIGKRHIVSHSPQSLDVS